VGRVRLLERVDLVVSEVQAERGDSFARLLRFGRSDDRGGDGGVAEHPRQRDLGHADAASGGDFLDGVDDGSSRGESKDLTTSSTVERWDCSPRGAPGSAGRFGEIAPVSVSEVRRAPYVHDQHHPDHGVRSASSWCVVTTADGVMRTTTMGGGPQATAGARRRCEAASYAIAQPRPIASSAVAAGREGTHNQVLVRSRPANGFARRAERGGTKTRPCRRS